MRNNTAIQTSPPTYKQSPLGPIPIDWEVKKGADISIKITKGSSPKWQGFQYQSQGLLFVTSENVRDGVLDVSNPKFLPIEFNQIQQSSILNRGDILINLVGASIGRSCIYTIDTLANINQAVCLLRLKNDVLNTFVINYLSLPTCIERMLNTKSASAQPNLTLENIRDFPVPIPPYMEQEAIAKLLTTWDKAIEKTNQLIAAKEQRKKWLMQQLLTGKKRLNGDNGLWEEVKMGDIFDRVARRNTELNSNVVTISAQKGFINQGDYFNKIVASDILDNYFLVHKGEFCYNKSYSNGYPWGATKRLNDFEKAVVTTLYICFGIKDNQKNSGEFFEHFFESRILDKSLMKIAHEGGRAHGLLNVTPTDFFNLKITIPRIKEQVAIANILQIADKEINLLKQKLEAYKEQKKGLMQVLLTGKVRLKI